MRAILFLPSVISIVVSICGCGGEPSMPMPPPPANIQVPQPVIEIVQTVNLPAAQAWDEMKNILAKRNISVASASKTQGEIDTAPITVTDKMCGVYNSENAPLTCQVRYFIKVEQVTPIASSVGVRYVEKCLERKDIQLECPGSQAELTMKAMIAELKARAGVTAN